MLSVGEKPKVENLCPFGCENADLDEFGYCKHLIGWTNRGKKLERRTIDEWGREVTQGIEEVQKTDVLVHRTGSSRVYRRAANEDTTKIAEKRKKKQSEEDQEPDDKNLV